MSEFQNDSECQGCGARLPQGTMGILCFDCLGKVGLESTMDGASRVDGQTTEGLKEFGEYDIQALIGQGGMGVVYRAFQRNLRRPVALKLLSDLSPRAIRQFQIGAEAAAKLDHPNVVPIFDHGTQLDRPFLTMKLVDGESLKRRIAGGAYTLGKEKGDRIRGFSRQEKIVRLMVTVAEAVQHAHENGVVHRDLKPGNILIDSEGRPQIVDFGLAEIVDEQRGSRASGLAGTPAYMSPEQVQEERAREASDIYSLGVVLYELLTGKPPFQADTLTETFSRISNEEPRRPRSVNPNIDAELETICLKCLEKEPRRRYSSAGVLAEELRRWLRGEPIQARPIGPVMRARKWVKRNRLGAALILTLLVGLLTLSGLLIALASMLRTAGEQNFELLDNWAENESKAYGDEATLEANIPSRMLRIMAGEPSLEGFAIELTLGVMARPDDQPAVVGMVYWPLTVRIEEHIGRQLGYDVGLGLRLHKPNAFESLRDAIELPEFLLMDFGNYLLHGTNLSGMAPFMISASGEDPAVLIVRDDSRVETVSDFFNGGGRIATGRPGDCVWIAMYLASVGIDPAVVRGLCLPASLETTTALVHQVRNGTYPAAVIPSRDLFEYETLNIRVVPGLDGLALSPDVLLVKTEAVELTPVRKEAWRAAVSDEALRRKLGPQFTGAVYVMQRMVDLEPSEVVRRLEAYRRLE